MSKLKHPEKSASWKERDAIGKSLVEQLEPRMSQSQVAKALGITRMGVQKIERQALYEMSQLLKEHAARITIQRSN